MPLRPLLCTIALCVAAAAHAYSIEGKTLAQLRDDLAAGRVTSAQLVQLYTARIKSIDQRGPKLQSVLAVNPDALAHARELDRERRERGARGPLHGIPILIKDNIETRDAMPTTAGSLALAQNFANRDAPIVARLRANGAIVLGKTNLSEWANFRSTRSISGWSAVGGLTKNPYVLDRSACGSSAGSGVAVAASLAAASLGTETDGSITCPASSNGVVGLKPTLGLLARQGIVPIAHSQDTAGPMGRAVTDVALLLAGMAGNTGGCEQPRVECVRNDYVAALNPNALQGKRIGVLRFAAGARPKIEPVYERALNQLRAAGATLVDVESPDASRIAVLERSILMTEFKADVNAYLQSTPASVRSRSLADLIVFNDASPREMIAFNQDIFLQAQSSAGMDDPKYRAAVNDAKQLAGADGISRLLSKDRLDALVSPSAGIAWRVDFVNGDANVGGGVLGRLAAVSGYPHLTVPMGDVYGLPVGISFVGPPWSEQLLLALGFAFEQRLQLKLTPKYLRSVEDDQAGLQRQR